MRKIERVAFAILNSAWTESDLAEIIGAIARPSFKTRFFSSELIARFPIAPSPSRLIDFLSRTKLGNEFRLRLLQRYESANQCKLNVMRAPLEQAKHWGAVDLPTVSDLAELVGLPISLLTWLAQDRHAHYRLQVIQKRSRGLRLLEAPKSHLKSVQRHVAKQILDAVPGHSAAHGFTRRRSAITFVDPHVAKPVILRMDLMDFFPSIHASRVFAVFRSLGYPYAVTQVLTNLCTAAVSFDALETAMLHIEPQGGQAQSRQAQDRLRKLYCDRHLPQGAPTSPKLANLIAYRLDCRLHGLAESAGVVYTRYADDLLFSGNHYFGRTAKSFAHQAAVIALEEGFEVNYRKTRVMRRATRQFAAGIVLNRRTNLQRDDYDNLRAILHNCVKSNPADQNRDAHSDFRSHLLGRINWVKQLNPQRGEKLMKTFNAIRW